MDKIVFSIIIFYFISVVSRILKDKGKKGRRQPPGLPPQPSRYPPPTRPSPLPFPQKDTGRPPAPILTPQETEALHILKDWETRAGRLKSRKLEQPLPAKKTADARFKTEKPILKMIKPAVEKKAGVPAEDKTFFHNPEQVRQGIIISEILRPPLARRNPLLPPFLRG
jgi:hypothetical protein